jgi:hypothetical protein
MTSMNKTTDAWYTKGAIRVHITVWPALTTHRKNRVLISGPRAMLYAPPGWGAMHQGGVGQPALPACLPVRCSVLGAYAKLRVRRISRAAKATREAKQIPNTAGSRLPRGSPGLQQLH